MNFGVLTERRLQFCAAIIQPRGISAHWEESSVESLCAHMWQQIQPETDITMIQYSYTSTDMLSHTITNNKNILPLMLMVSLILNRALKTRLHEFSDGKQCE